MTQYALVALSDQTIGMWVTNPNGGTNLQGQPIPTTSWENVSVSAAQIINLIQYDGISPYECPDGCQMHVLTDPTQKVGDVSTGVPFTPPAPSTTT
jgi:hypothetical protein